MDNQHDSGYSSSSFLFRSNNIPLELARYLDDVREFLLIYYDGGDKMNANTSILSIMVLDLLALLVSTVAPESVFSTGGRVLSDLRSKHKADILENLLCLKDWEDAKFQIQDRMHRMMAEELEELNT
ncbi:Uncharacterized protein Adt_06064 [Abeliophyllum distichum]|uniref:HAT C-terminal dimerisation domain-containing protein n=1 Tax=Abeliophyllum distichum TaxID=126358 RepID=A0ABD1V824_9LAMI